MSIVIQFPNLPAVQQFLKRMVQRQAAHLLSDHDVFHVYTEIRSRRGAGGQTENFPVHTVYLETAIDPEVNREFGQVIALLGGVMLLHLPPPTAQQTRRHSLAEFLQRISLVPAVMSRRARPDLLVAFYDVDSAALGRAFAAVPKTPGERTRIVHLDQPRDGPPGLPSSLMILPQADPLFQWPIWLESEDRRLRQDPGRRAVQLFYRIPDGKTADYFVEFGWQHPLPEVRELYPNPDNAQYILIAATSPDGSRNTRWLHILPDAVTDAQEIEADRDAVLAIELDGDPEVELIQAVRPARPLRLRPSVVEVAGAHRADLEGIERRIQGTKDVLFRLEQERRSLLDRRQDRSRLLLCFHQPPQAQGATPALAEPFRRFLLLSRRQLKQLKYAFRDTDRAGGGFHLVATAEPVLRDEFHVGLADQVYYQPASWQEWGFEAFVRDDCALLPRLDDKDLADKLAAALRGATGANEQKGEPVLLLEPADRRPEGVPKITVVNPGLKTDLDRLLDVVNTDYPTTEVESRTQARAQMTHELDQARVELEKEVAATEQRIANTALERLKQVQVLWNDLAERLDAAMQSVQISAGEFAIFEQIVGDFGIRWEAMVSAVLKLNDGLIKAKLAALDRLGKAQQGWNASIDRVHQGNTDVEGILAGLKGEIDAKVAKAKEHCQRAEELAREVEQAAKDALRVLDDLIERCKRVESGAQSRLEEVERRQEKLDERKQAVEGLLTALKAAVERAEHTRNELSHIVGAIEDQIKQLEAVLDQIEKTAGQITGAVKAWRDQKAKADAALAATTKVHQEAKEEIDAIQRKIDGGLKKAQEMGKTLESDKQRLDNGLKAEKEEENKLNASIAEVEKKIEDLKKVRGDVADLRALLKEVEREKARREKELDDASRELAQDAEQLDEDRKKRLANLVRKCRRAARALDDLAELELDLAPLKRYLRAHAMRKRVEKAKRSIVPMQAETHQAIWS
jgi:hypothetical protein